MSIVLKPPFFGHIANPSSLTPFPVRGQQRMRRRQRMRGQLRMHGQS